MTEKIDKIYCFLGLPGSGKGTQIEIMAKRINARVISIGDEIREELEGADMSDPFYRQMKERYDEGTPQPDEVVADIVKTRIASSKGNLIFDNFPFSHNQADLFFKICRELDVELPTLIVIAITPEASIHRIVYRKVCSDCGHVMINDGDTICEKCGGPMVSRSDDNVETVSDRIKNYTPRIEEVKGYFKEKGKVIEIDGKGTIEEVSKLISEAI